MLKKLIVVSDWADDSLSCQELRTSVEGFLNNPAVPHVSFVSSTPSTIHTSFLTAQIVENEERLGRPMDTVILVDCDLHAESTEAPLYIIRLKTGLYAIGPNAGYSFAGIRQKIDRVFSYPDAVVGAQFRTRDFTARLVAHLLESMQDDLQLDEVHLSQIPELQGVYVGHIDNFGNIKTTIKKEVITQKYSIGQRIGIKIQGTTHHARFVDHIMQGQKGELLLYPGSSGDIQNPLMELAVFDDFSEKTSTAADEFHAKPGMEISVEGL